MIQRFGNAIDLIIELIYIRIKCEEERGRVVEDEGDETIVVHCV